MKLVFRRHGGLAHRGRLYTDSSDTKVELAERALPCASERYIITALEEVTSLRYRVDSLT